MNKTFNPTVVDLAEGHIHSFMPASIQEPRPSTIVLQPSGFLDQTSSLTFQRDLEAALENAADAVIVDFLWVDLTDSHGIAALVAGIQQATGLGKALSFQGMDTRTRTALAAEWSQQREASFGPWRSLFKQDLEDFLDSLQPYSLGRT